jgi:hypothetical protein
MKLFGIEPHPTFKRTELQTYVCSPCDAVKTQAIPLRPLKLARRCTETTVPHLPDAAAFDSETTHILGLAFEAAWETVNASGSMFADASHAAQARELLAKRIIELAQEGERDHHRLVENALAYLATAGEADTAA